MLRLDAVLHLLLFPLLSFALESPQAQSPAQPPSTASHAENTQTAKSSAPAPLPNLLGEAKALARSGNFDGAIAKYQQLLQTSPNSPDAFAGIIRAYLKKKEVAGAANAAKDALAVSDTHTVRTAVAELEFRQGKIAEAEREWANVINSGYPDARAYLGLARVRRAVSMYKSAQKMIEKAYALDPLDTDIQRMWLTTLPPAERIKYLELSLTGPNDLTAEQRSDTQHYLDYLRARGKLSKHGCRLLNKLTATETPLVRLLEDAHHLRGYGLSVSINGHKSNLLLDTGASGIVINRSFAEKAGITKISETLVGGIGDKGSKDGYLAVADSIKIGELEFQNCTVEVVESRSVADESGLLGSDIFGSFLVDIDFPNEKFKLAELPKLPDEPAANVALQDEDDSDGLDSGGSSEQSHESAQKPKPQPASGLHDRYIAPEMKSFTQVFRIGHNLLVPTFIANLPVSKLFILDTGGFNNLISTSAAAEVTKVHGDSHTTVKGVSGSVKNVYRADKAMLAFGHLRQENEDLVAFDLTSLSNNVGTEVSGLLGFAMLRLLEIKIDYRDGLVDFSYDPKRWGQ
jgi:tetratricopeptide (TPR) repeat protein